MWLIAVKASVLTTWNEACVLVGTPEGLFAGAEERGNIVFCFNPVT